MYYTLKEKDIYMPAYYDLHVSSDNLEDKIQLAEHLGWNGMCVTTGCGDIKKITEKIASIKTCVDICVGAELNPDSSRELKTDSRKALESADLIMVNSGSDEIKRMATESWEIDILCCPEKSAERDFMKQKNSGLDKVMTKLMQERGVGIEFNLKDILDRYGMLRAQIMGRMHQNIILARKYGALMILTSSAEDKWGLRSPRDLICVGRILGMTDSEAKAAVSTNPLTLIEKSRNRKNPSIITKGLEVIEWGNQKPKEKKMYGWY